MLFSSLFAFVAAATAVVAQPANTGRPLNPPLSSLHTVDWAALPPASVEALTNAKRFARGLPPLSPRRRNHGLGTRVASAPRAETSPVAPASNKCNILVKNASTGQELGFISKEWNKVAEYGPLESTQLGALEVSFSASPDTRTDRIDLVTTNGKSPAYPFFGGVVGYGSDDESISAGSPNYLIIVGTTQTPAGSTPSSDAKNSFSEVSNADAAGESAIWSYDPISRIFTPQWVNPDGTSAIPSIILTSQEGEDFFAMPGDVATFRSTYGVTEPEVTFTCVPSMVAL